MERVEILREFLKKEYGITSEKELNRAIKDMAKPDIGLFVTRLEE
jgi:hypothetical protein